MLSYTRYILTTVLLSNNRISIFITIEKKCFWDKYEGYTATVRNHRYRNMPHCFFFFCYLSMNKLLTKILAPEIQYRDGSGSEICLIRFMEWINI